MDRRAGWGNVYALLICGRLPVRYPFTALVKQVGRMSENEMGDGIGGETLIGRLGQASD